MARGGQIGCLWVLLEPDKWVLSRRRLCGSCPVLLARLIWRPLWPGHPSWWRRFEVEYRRLSGQSRGSHCRQRGAYILGTTARVPQITSAAGRPCCGFRQRGHRGSYHIRCGRNHSTRRSLPSWRSEREAGGTHHYLDWRQIRATSPRVSTPSHWLQGFGWRCSPHRFCCGWTEGYWSEDGWPWASLTPLSQACWKCCRPWMLTILSTKTNVYSLILHRTELSTI